MPEKRTVLALGCFDGLHLGHRDVLLCALAEAKRRGASPACWMLTGCDHKSGGELFSPDERIGMLARIGMETVFSADFQAIRQLSCAEFVRGELLSRYGACCVVCGENFRFGRDAAGDADTLHRLMREAGGDCTVVPKRTLYGETVSSTAVKAYLREGDPRRAAELLGSPFFIRERVSEGRHFGRTVGFPTANQRLAPGLVRPRYGVYRTRVTLPDGSSYRACSHLGVRPTFEENGEPILESFLPDYHGGALYGQALKTELLDFIRPERRFDCADDLREQMQKDLESIR